MMGKAQENAKKMTDEKETGNNQKEANRRDRKNRGHKEKDSLHSATESRMWSYSGLHFNE